MTDDYLFTILPGQSTLLKPKIILSSFMFREHIYIYNTLQLQHYMQCNQKGASIQYCKNTTVKVCDIHANKIWFLE